VQLWQEGDNKPKAAAWAPASSGAIRGAPGTLIPAYCIALVFAGEVCRQCRPIIAGEPQAQQMAAFSGSGCSL